MPWSLFLRFVCVCAAVTGAFLLRNTVVVFGGQRAGLHADVHGEQRLLFSV
jgi:hypothetical protein